MMGLDELASEVSASCYMELTGKASLSFKVLIISHLVSSKLHGGWGRWGP